MRCSYPPVARAGSERTVTTGLSVMAVGAQPRRENGTAGYIAKFSDTTDVVSSVMFENNGFVGFGTANPNHGLHVLNNSPWSSGPKAGSHRNSECLVAR